MQRVIALAFAAALCFTVVALLVHTDDPMPPKVIPGKCARAEQIDVSEFENVESSGWVFGRLVGATQTPGASNYSPFGKSTDSLGEN